MSPQLILNRPVSQPARTLAARTLGAFRTRDSETLSMSALNESQNKLPRCLVQFRKSPPRRRGGSVWVFLVRGCFAWKSPLPGVGFPLISLESLVRIETYQRVTPDFRWKNFSWPFAPWSVRNVGEKSRRRGYGKRRRVHKKLNVCSNFLQSIVSPPGFHGRLHFKGDSARQSSMAGPVSIQTRHRWKSP